MIQYFLSTYWLTVAVLAAHAAFAMPEGVRPTCSQRIENSATAAESAAVPALQRDNWDPIASQVQPVLDAPVFARLMHHTLRRLNFQPDTALDTLRLFPLPQMEGARRQFAKSFEEILDEHLGLKSDDWQNLQSQLEARRRLGLEGAQELSAIEGWSYLRTHFRREETQAFWEYQIARAAQPNAPEASWDAKLYIQPMQVSQQLESLLRGEMPLLTNTHATGTLAPLPVATSALALPAAGSLSTKDEITLLKIQIAEIRRRQEFLAPQLKVSVDPVAWFRARASEIKSAGVRKYFPYDHSMDHGDVAIWQQRPFANPAFRRYNELTGARLEFRVDERKIRRSFFRKKTQYRVDVEDLTSAAFLLEVYSILEQLVPYLSGQEFIGIVRELGVHLLDHHKHFVPTEEGEMKYWENMRLLSQQIWFESEKEVDELFHLLTLSTNTGYYKLPLPEIFSKPWGARQPRVRPTFSPATQNPALQAVIDENRVLEQRLIEFEERLRWLERMKQTYDKNVVLPP